MSGLLLAPRPVETQAPTAAPVPGAGPPPATPATPPAPDADRSPMVARPDPAPTAADPDRDPNRATGPDASRDEPAPAAPDAATLLGLPVELGIGQLAPSADPVAPAPAPADGDAVPMAAATGEGGAPAGRAAPLLAGLLVSLAVLGGGSGWLWWRNRDRHYWPA